MADHRLGQPKNAEHPNEGGNQGQTDPTQSARLRAAADQRCAHGVQCRDHVGVFNLNRFAGRSIVQPPGGEEGWHRPGIDPLNRGQRPMRQRHFRARIGQNQRCIAQAHHHLAQLGRGCQPPQPDTFQALVFRQSGHGALQG